MKQTELELLAEINQKLKLILAALSIQGKEVGTQIRMLKNLDLDWKEIGNLVGLEPDTARMRYSRKGK